MSDASSPIHAALGEIPEGPASPYQWQKNSAVEPRYSFYTFVTRLNPSTIVQGCSGMGGHIRGLGILSLGLVLGWEIVWGQYGNSNDVMGTIMAFSGFCVLLLFCCCFFSIQISLFFLGYFAVFLLS
jgi:hypothetical protein